MKCNILWNIETKTMLLANVDTDIEGDLDVIGELKFTKPNDTPPAVPFPQPGQHLRNIALQRGITDFSEVRVINTTGLNYLDQFATDVAEEVEYLEDEQTEEQIEEETSEPVELTDDEKKGDDTIGLPAYNDITVKQLQEKLGDDGSNESDKQTLYAAYLDQLSKVAAEEPAEDATEDAADT